MSKVSMTFETKALTFDVMRKGRFVRTLTFPLGADKTVTEEQILLFVRQQIPSLKNKEFTIAW